MTFTGLIGTDADGQHRVVLSDWDAKALALYLGKRGVDAEMDLTVAPHVKTRTDRQSRYYFATVVPLLAEFCGYDKQAMHETLAMRFLRVEDCPVTGAPRRRHTPKTNTKEFGEYIDACIRLAAEHGVYIPEPGERTDVA